MMNLKRDAYWDTLKLVLIFLVAFGHFLELNLTPNSMGQALYNFIYAFHMPLFVFVSGFFSHIRTRERYLWHIWELLAYYLVFQAIHIGIGYFCYHTPVTLQSLLIPAFSLWYLLSLVCWRVMVYCLPARWLEEKKVLLLVLSVVICLLAGFLPVNKVLSIQKTLTLLPFFTMGYYAREVDVRKWLQKVPAVVAVAVLVGVFLLMYLLLNRPVEPLYFNSGYLSDSLSHTLQLFVARCFLLLLATAAGISAMRLTPSVGALACYGRYTLYIYLGHVFVRMLLMEGINRQLIPSSLLALFLYALATVTVMAVCFYYVFPSRR